MVNPSPLFFHCETKSYRSVTTVIMWQQCCPLHCDEPSDNKNAWYKGVRCNPYMSLIEIQITDLKYMQFTLRCGCHHSQ